MDGCVYILSNAANTTVYTGVTSDLIHRMEEHKLHKYPTSFTARYHVTKLVYYELHDDIRSAIAREKQIKSRNRKRKNDLINSLNPEWKDLTPYLEN